MAAEEPGFTIVVVVAGAVVEIQTTAAIARRNVIQSSKMRGTGLPRPLTEADLRDRGALLEALGTVAADVLLAGDQSIRVMQDKAGHWWSFRRDQVGAVEVRDDAPVSSSPRKVPIGFRLIDGA